MQDIAAGCVGLLRAIATALSERSAVARRMVQQQQQQQQTGSSQQHAQLLPAACELRATGMQLLAAAGRLPCCMKEHQMCSEVAPQQLLAVLGDLLRKVPSGPHACSLLPAAIAFGCHLCADSRSARDRDVPAERGFLLTCLTHSAGCRVRGSRGACRCSWCVASCVHLASCHLCGAAACRCCRRAVNDRWGAELC